MDSVGRSPLHYAAFNNEVDSIEALIASGESPDARDKQDFTPLHLAAQQYSVAAATALLDAGASVDAENAFGNTPLFLAAFHSNGRAELIGLLRSRGADPLHANATGQTPVRLARLFGRHEVARFFADVPEE
jgi:ankyrin repeat protein